MFEGAAILRFGGGAKLRVRASWFGPAGVQTLLAVVLVLMIAVQCVRLFWTIVTPVGPSGNWRPASIHSASSGNSAFDPFFRLQPGNDSAIVTSLALKLFGVRVDNASGRGSAIIATPDGVQSSYAVGEEIMPGVVLTRVAFDNVTIERSGVAEQIFLDQSVAAPVVSPPVSGDAAKDGGPALLANAIEIAPKLEGSKISGMVLNPKGDGALFKSAGLEPGDLLISVNGKSVGEGEDIRSVLASGSSALLEIQRGGRRMTISAKTGP